MPSLLTIPPRMIAIDLDGTLLDPHGEVTPRVRAAVHAVLAAGLVVCFATGRNWTESRAVLESVGHYPPCVFVGGAVVVDTARDVTLRSTLMAPELARDVCAALADQPYPMQVLQQGDDGAGGIDYLVPAGAELSRATVLWLEATRARFTAVPDLATHPHSHTVRVGLVAPTPAVAAAESMLATRFGDRIMMHRVTVAAWGVEVLEAFDPRVSKWDGISFLAYRAGIDPAQVIAVGDDLNDLSMIRGAGLGVAMGNAHPAVKQLAALTIGPNTDEGLAIFLEALAAS